MSSLTTRMTLKSKLKEQRRERVAAALVERAAHEAAGDTAALVPEAVVCVRRRAPLHPRQRRRRRRFLYPVCDETPRAPRRPKTKTPRTMCSCSAKEAEASGHLLP